SRRVQRSCSPRASRTRRLAGTRRHRARDAPRRRRRDRSWRSRSAPSPSVTRCNGAPGRRTERTMHQPWWPSKFGAEDQLGMLNHVTASKRAEALSLVREGRLYDLGRVLDETVPVFPGRYFRQTLVSTAHHAGGNWITEIVTGTQQ